MPLLLLQADQEELQGLAGQRVLKLKEDELKRPGQALMGKSGAGPGDSESARGWPQCVSSSQLRQLGQPQGCCSDGEREDCIHNGQEIPSRNGDVLQRWRR